MLIKMKVPMSCCSVTQLCPTFWRPHGLHHARLPCPLLSLGVCSNYVHWVSDAIQPSHPLSPPSPPAFSLSQHQGLFQKVQWIEMFKRSQANPGWVPVVSLPISSLCKHLSFIAWANWATTRSMKHEAIAIECPVQKFTFSLLKHKRLRFQR